MPLIIDSHEDLSDNMLAHGRDYTLPMAVTRSLEAQLEDDHKPEPTLLGWQEYQQGQVAVIFSTLFAAPHRLSSNKRDHTYKDYNQAHQIYQQQLDLYHRLVDEKPEYFRLIKTQPDLGAVLDAWNKPGKKSEDPQDTRPAGRPVGLVILMEGADGVRSPEELEEWWAGGVRIIGLAWAGTRYSGGTREPGPITPEGFTLLEAMADLGFTLDLSHMDSQAALQALDRYPGAVIASHANPIAMLKGSDSNRHLPDTVVDGLIARNGVIGIVPFNIFLKHGWSRQDGKQSVPLDVVVAHIDYICQRAGDARHVGIGSDFDGGFGLPSVPDGIDSIADLQKLAPLLAQKGYSPEDIAAILARTGSRYFKEFYRQNDLSLTLSGADQRTAYPNPDRRCP